MTDETTEGQLTPAMVKAMQSFNSGERRTYRRLTTGAGIFTLMMVVGIFSHILKEPILFLILGGLGAMFFLVFFAGSIWGNWASTKAMQNTKYKRVSGAMRAERYEAPMLNSSGTYTKHRLVIGGDQFPLEPDVFRQLENLKRGTAEYAAYTFGRIILFEVKDADGQRVYRYPKYVPA